MLKTSLRKILFWLAKRKFSGRLLSWCFAYLPRLIPVDYLYRSSLALIFHHPIGYWKSHFVAVARHYIPALTELRDERDFALMSEVLFMAEKLGEEFMIFCNYGSFQDVPLLHFHLVSGPTRNDSEPFRNKSIAYSAILNNVPAELEELIQHIGKRISEVKLEAATLTLKSIGKQRWEALLLT
jgi:diadenosine tetraphosphate (Ap4A) HIT family hydrolase